MDINGLAEIVTGGAFWLGGTIVEQILNSETIRLDGTIRMAPK